MANDAQKISAVAIATTLLSTDRVVVISNATTTANVQTITLANLANSMPASKLSSVAPVTSTSNGVTGQVAFDVGYIYVCVATNTWKRVSISSF